MAKALSGAAKWRGILIGASAWVAVWILAGAAKQIGQGAIRGLGAELLVATLTGTVACLAGCLSARTSTGLDHLHEVGRDAVLAAAAGAPTGAVVGLVYVLLRHLCG
jgi:hypothetical protein